MAAFKAKPLDAGELTAALKSQTSTIPRTTGDLPETQQSTSAPVQGRVATAKMRPPKVVQVNFACTPDMAKLIAGLAAQEGSTRRMIAKLLHAAGHEVPNWDLDPVSNRREL